MEFCALLKFPLRLWGMKALLSTRACHGAALADDIELSYVISPLRIHPDITRSAARWFNVVYRGCIIAGVGGDAPGRRLVPRVPTDAKRTVVSPRSMRAVIFARHFAQPF
jgi:hypothetical protein